MRPEDVGKRYERGIPQKYFLSESGRNLLLTEYDSMPETVTMLAQELEVPRWVIHKWAGQLDITKTQSRWTAEQDEQLEALYFYMGIADIARSIGHSEIGVKIRARRLGINKRSEGHTMHSLSMALGCSHSKVLRWIEKGWLKAIRRKTLKPHDTYYISNAAICTLIRAHPNEIDLRRVDQLWFIDLAFGVRGGARSEKDRNLQTDTGD